MKFSSSLFPELCKEHRIKQGLDSINTRIRVLGQILVLTLSEENTRFHSSESEIVNFEALNSAAPPLRRHLSDAAPVSWTKRRLSKRVFDDDYFADCLIVLARSGGSTCSSAGDESSSCGSTCSLVGGESSSAALTTRATSFTAIA
ncbi:hypothetical protein SASPL_138002 [Salvia splendens]|uniref:Uncharacterized protein n=1 Tax=Salvia splendens TaxID=180675 RepID=A0A8X8ZDQ4_SALSN|nr:hypothetical protein SASPL_138002 [Salvia splendens]